MEVLYQDNHIIIVNKAPGEITQGDRTGDVTLVQQVKDYIKETFHKPGNVFLGVVHRLDRPTSGVVVYAKTSKALSRMNELFRSDKVHKTYHAIVEKTPVPDHGKLLHYLKKNEQQNKSYVVTSSATGAKKALLTYETLAHSERYTLLSVNLQTGRHHQIRCQLSAIGSPIRGDLKYGARRSNPNGSISLHAYRIQFTHPVSQQPIDVTAPYPESDSLWAHFAALQVP